MSNTGMGAMLHYLSGGSEHDPSEYYGKIIKYCYMDGDCLCIEFKDGVKIDVWDDGQSCCESRYMTTDDDPSSLNGDKLISIEAKNVEEEDEEYGEVHEQVFVEFATDKGFITIVNHNEHNGFYGGFGLTITERNI